MFQFKCCGAIRHEDWKASVWLRVSQGEKRLVPDSCCKTVSLKCGIRDHPSNIHYTVRLHTKSIVFLLYP